VRGFGEALREEAVAAGVVRGFGEALREEAVAAGVVRGFGDALREAVAAGAFALGLEARFGFAAFAFADVVADGFSATAPARFVLRRSGRLRGRLDRTSRSAMALILSQTPDGGNVAAQSG
jgi:hypothetical protein